MGDLDKALQVAATIKASNLPCDELVYNSLMDGCVRAGDLSAGIGLFAEMVRSGVQPSAISHGILTRLYQKSGGVSDACEAVAQLYLHHGLSRPDPALELRSRRRGGASRARRNSDCEADAKHVRAPRGQQCPRQANRGAASGRGRGVAGRGRSASGRGAAHEHGNDDIKRDIPVLLISIKRARLAQARRVVVLIHQFDGRLRRGDRRVEELEAFLPDAHGDVSLPAGSVRGSSAAHCAAHK